VIVTGVEQGLVPHGSASTPAQIAEEARLLYVAVTRAGVDLTITSAAARKGAAVGDSPWLPALRAAAEPTGRVAPPRGLPRRTAPPDPLAELRAWRASIARAAAVADVAVCSDRTLRSLLADPPVDAAGLAQRLGVGVGTAERMAPRLLGILAVQSAG